VNPNLRFTRSRAILRAPDADDVWVDVVNSMRRRWLRMRLLSRHDSSKMRKCTGCSRLGWF